MRPPTSVLPSLLAASALVTLASLGRAEANTCQTDQLLPAHATLPAGCPLHVYARVNQGLTVGDVTAARGDASIVVGTAAGSQGGSAPVLHTLFDRDQCAWRDEVELIGFDVYRIEVASQAGDTLSFGSPFTVEVGPAGACPAAAMSWQPACADPLPPPACLPMGGDHATCDAGVDEAALGHAGHEHGGGCAAGGGAGGLPLAGALGGLWIGWRRRRRA